MGNNNLIIKILIIILFILSIFGCSKNKTISKKKQQQIEFIKWNSTLLVKGAQEQGKTKQLAGYIKAVFRVKANWKDISIAYKKHNFIVIDNDYTLVRDKTTIKLIPINDTSTNLLFDIKP